MAKKVYKPAVLSVGLEVCDRKTPNRLGVVVSLDGGEAKVQWSDGTVWSYAEQNQKFLENWKKTQPKVFRKEKVAA